MFNIQSNRNLWRFDPNKLQNWIHTMFLPIRMSRYVLCVCICCCLCVYYVLDFEFTFCYVCIVHDRMGNANILNFETQHSHSTHNTQLITSGLIRLCECCVYVEKRMEKPFSTFKKGGCVWPHLCFDPIGRTWCGKRITGPKELYI